MSLDGLDGLDAWITGECLCPYCGQRQCVCEEEFEKEEDGDIGMRWEQSEKGTWWIVEHDGQMRTGPFETKEKGREFFRKEFEIELGEEDEHGNISRKG